MNVDEAQGRACAPMSEEALLHMLGLEWLSQQGIGSEIDHADGEIVCGTPIGMHFPQLVVGEALFGRSMKFRGIRTGHVRGEWCMGCTEARAGTAQRLDELDRSCWTGRASQAPS